jgi:hypothetical protein
VKMRRDFDHTTRRCLGSSLARRRRARVEVLRRYGTTLCV